MDTTNATKIFSHDSQPLERDLNMNLPEHAAGLLNTRHNLWWYQQDEIYFTGFGVNLSISNYTEVV
jgi:hypothetical protein